ncbi:uncharacterized protein LOC121010832 [Herpailurus yagouaroundi]|uniref:uncharacterized protein LOC121010832 n=1 Tax=Herpailurus yagouaroundi TaxID=1608482 RepID=UPI001AD77BA5|nr:uncharacterized protein LOC121010832 [Puma yagouaroundi]
MRKGQPPQCWASSRDLPRETEARSAVGRGGDGREPGRRNSSLSDSQLGPIRALGGWAEKPLACAGQCAEDRSASAAHRSARAAPGGGGSLGRSCLAHDLGGILILKLRLSRKSRVRILPPPEFVNSGCPVLAKSLSTSEGASVFSFINQALEFSPYREGTRLEHLQCAAILVPSEKPGKQKGAQGNTCVTPATVLCVLILTRTRQDPTPRRYRLNLSLGAAPRPAP